GSLREARLPRITMRFQVAKETLDERSRQFRAEVEVVVMKYAGAFQDADWVLRWRQLYNWGMTYSQGDIGRKEALKQRLMKKTGGSVRDGKRKCPGKELEMPRVDGGHTRSLSKNCGYFEENIALLCAKCHHAREKKRSQEKQCPALNE